MVPCFPAAAWEGWEQKAGQGSMHHVREHGESLNP